MKIILYILIIIAIACTKEDQVRCYTCYTHVYNVVNFDLVYAFQIEKCDTKKGIQMYEQAWNGRYIKFINPISEIPDSVRVEYITRCYETE